MFFIPRAYGTSIQMTGDASAALWAFLVFYVTCLALTWFVYTRRGGLLHDIERSRGGDAIGEARRMERRV
jgi:NNP family nitrate/nitrite transporter-like MFS transporter